MIPGKPSKLERRRGELYGALTVLSVALIFLLSSILGYDTFMSTEFWIWMSLVQFAAVAFSYYRYRALTPPLDN